MSYKPLNEYRTLTLYQKLIKDLSEKFGSQRAVARQLGVAHQTLANRVTNNGRVKREHILAAQKLIEMVELQPNKELGTRLQPK